MSDDLTNRRERKLKRAYQIEYWMVTQEWMQLYEQPAQDGIVGSKKQFAQREVGMAAIDVNPVIHGIRMLQSGYQKYAIIFAMPISKQMFDLIHQPTPTEAKIAEMADAIDKENAQEALKDKDPTSGTDYANQERKLGVESKPQTGINKP